MVNILSTALNSTIHLSIYGFKKFCQNAKVIVPITKAAYFEKICFVLLPNMVIVELVKLKEKFVSNLITTVA